MKRTERQGKECIQMWKQEYEEIPVPKEAKERMIQGIHKAKAEQKRRDFMNTWKKTGLTAAAVVITFGAAVNISPTVANAMEGIPVIGSIARVVTFRHYTNDTGNTQADIKVPQMGKNTAVNDDLKAYAEALIADYEKELKETSGDAHFSVQSDYQVVFDNDAYVSLEIDSEIISAGGTQKVKVFTVDKTTGEAVSLLDYVGGQSKLDAVTENIKKQMAEQVAEGKSYFAEKEDGGFKALLGTESFYPNADGSIVIVFNEYDIAPGSMGVVRFTIPQAAFA